MEEGDNSAYKGSPGIKQIIGRTRGSADLSD